MLLSEFHINTTCRVLMLSAIATLSSVESAHANITGNTLMQACRFFPSKTESSVYCMGYISGVLDDMRVWGDLMGHKNVCLPSGVEGEQLILIAIKFMKDNPDKLHYVASSLIATAYMQAFPCR